MMKWKKGLNWQQKEGKWVLGSQGGSDGCIDFADPDNKGLLKCLKKFGLPDIYRNHCDKVSLADFIVIAGEALMGRTATDYNKDDHFAEGTTAGSYLKSFRYGRKTQETCPEAVGLMPNPENGCPGLYDVFTLNIFLLDK